MVSIRGLLANLANMLVAAYRSNGYTYILAATTRFVQHDYEDKSLEHIYHHER